jgi:hypothetical protein
VTGRLHRVNSPFLPAVSIDFSFGEGYVAAHCKLRSVTLRVHTVCQVGVGNEIKIQFIFEWKGLNRFVISSIMGCLLLTL